MQRHRDREKEEIEAAKIFLEEIRFNKNQLWRVTYYGVIIYAGIFSTINLFKDKLLGDLSWLGMFYYQKILLITSKS